MLALQPVVDAAEQGSTSVVLPRFLPIMVRRRAVGNLVSQLGGAEVGIDTAGGA